MTGLQQNALKQLKKQYRVKILITSDMGIGTGSDKWNSNKKITKTSSTVKVKDIGEKNTRTKLFFAPYNVDIP